VESQLQQKVQEYAQGKAAQQSAHNKALSEANTIFEDRLAALRVAHSEKVQEHEVEYEALSAAQQTAHEHELAKHQDKHERLVEQQREDSETCLASILLAKEEELADTVATLEQKFNAARDEREQLHLREMEAQEAEVSQARVEHESQLVELKCLHSEQIQVHVDEGDTQRWAHEKTLAQVDQAHEKELASAREALAEFNEAHDRHRQEVY
jgi:hypothetical protein